MAQTGDRDGIDVMVRPPDVAIVDQLDSTMRLVRRWKGDVVTAAAGVVQTLAFHRRPEGAAA